MVEVTISFDYRVEEDIRRGVLVVEVADGGREHGRNYFG
jgi:hypothetical protein